MTVPLRQVEPCYVCQQPIVRGELAYILRDADGLLWYVHKVCMSEMELVR